MGTAIVGKLSADPMVASSFQQTVGWVAPRLKRPMRQGGLKAGSRAKWASSPRGCCVRRYESGSEFMQSRLMGSVSAHSVRSPGSRAAGQQRRPGTAVLSMTTLFGKDAL